MTAVGISSRAAFYLFVVAQVSVIFLQFCEFSFFFLWELKRMRFINVDAFFKVRHTSTGFPKRCDRILINDKKSAESDVAPAGIKSYKFLFVLKKICFAVFKKLIG